MRVLTKIFLAIVLCAVIGMQVAAYRNPSSASGIEPQDASYLDRRISLLENRLGSLESSVRMLGQQATSQRSAPAQPTRDPEVALLRSEVEILNARLRELECGVVHLDERVDAVARSARTTATNLSSSASGTAGPGCP